MRAASSVREVLADPIGAYFAGESFLVWFHPGLAGAFAFGRLAQRDIPAIQELLVSPVLARGYAMLCDFGAVEVLDDRGFQLLTAFFDAGGAALLRNVRKLAVVRPAGLPGAGLAGLFYDRVQQVVDGGLFADRAEALAWLGYAADARERAEITELIATVHHVPPTLRRLRELLVTDIADATLARAARALGTSERSLQRELADAETSFRAELKQARIRVAESLLIGTDDKIEAIARRLGFGSVPAFTALFGSMVGESPHDFRRRRRGA